MFYEPRKKNHGLPHDPYNAIVGPRPIGWITSINLKGDINLAPYSYFNSVSTYPDGFLDTGAMKPIARAGYQEYFVTTADARFFLKFTEAHKMRAQSYAKKTEE